MTRREGKGPPPGDLLVCFPTRARLALMPKPTCSPRRRLQHHQNHLRKSMRGGSIGGGHASPYLWSGTKEMGSHNLSEPTSPKVTCAGQIKVRPNTRSCKNWQTVMEEIERLHNNRKKKTTWVEALGFKKEVMHFLSYLRRLNFDFNCLGSFSHVDITSDEEDEDEDKNDKEINQDQDQDHNDYGHDNKQEEDSSQTVFSKWFMVLQENQDCGVFEKDENIIKLKETEDPPSLPPSNALLLMRCRSAPAKSWKEEQEEEQQEKDVDDDDDVYDDHDHDHHHHHNQEHDKEDEHANKDDKLVKKESKRKSLMELMQNETEFYKLSCDIAKETWVIGGVHKDPFSRSRSWKR